jgi:hypothetical protein
MQAAKFAATQAQRRRHTKASQQQICINVMYATALTTGSALFSCNAAQMSRGKKSLTTTIGAALLAQTCMKTRKKKDAGSQSMSLSK